MKENKLGFLGPITCSECKNCGICTEVCPVIHEELLNTVEPLAAYSGWSNSFDVIMESSSGGVFHEIAKFVTEGAGKVSGSVMKGNRPYHIISDDIRDIARMRGSKYMQSKTLEAFGQFPDLSGDSPFLFSGTPCQVAAAKNLWVFQKHNERSLVTCDLICHGVPSYLVYDSYAKHYSSKNKIVSIDFRNKAFGWENYSVKINYSDGKDRIIPFKKDMFMRSYLADVGLRESCYNCKFSRIPRVGDITLGDFWGVPNHIRNKAGTSAIVANSTKGLEILAKLKKENRIILKGVDIHAIARRNPKLLSGMMEVPKERNEYLNCLSNRGFYAAYRKVVEPAWLRRRLYDALYSGINTLSNIIGNCSKKGNQVDKLDNGRV
jgi:coenzyme F420-reducing hydrogenase beta subunit